MVPSCLKRFLNLSLTRKKIGFITISHVEEVAIV